MTWLDKMHDSQDILRNLIRRIDHKAIAFEEVGNISFAKELDIWMVLIQKAHDQIHEAIGEKVDEDLRDAQERGTSTLKAILDGVIVAPKTTTEE